MHLKDVLNAGMLGTRRRISSVTREPVLASLAVNKENLAERQLKIEDQGFTVQTPYTLVIYIFQ